MQWSMHRLSPSNYTLLTKCHLLILRQTSSSSAMRQSSFQAEAQETYLIDSYVSPLPMVFRPTLAPGAVWKEWHWEAMSNGLFPLDNMSRRFNIKFAPAIIGSLASNSTRTQEPHLPYLAMPVDPR